MTALARVSGSLLLIALALPAGAHTRLTSPVPRSTSDALKSGPCGGVARGANPTVWKAGSQVKIEWEETIEHPGRYFLSFSFAGDQGFDQAVFSKNLPDVQDRNTLPHKYSYTLTVPNQTCDACTLQLIQSMEENPASPSYYYSCADIKIVSDTTGATPTPNPTSTPTPRPGATPTPRSSSTPMSTNPTPTPVGGRSEGSFSSDGTSGSGLQKPGMGGCGLVASAQSNQNGGIPPGAAAMVAAFLMPLLFLLVLRRREAEAVSAYARVKRLK